MRGEVRFPWMLTFNTHVESTASMWLDIRPAYGAWSWMGI